VADPFNIPTIDVIDIKEEAVRRPIPLFLIQLDESTVTNNISILYNIYVK